MITECFDLPILDWIAAHLRCGFLDRLMPAITRLGDAGILWILLAALFLCLPKYRKAGLTMAVSLLVGLLICNVTLKPLVARIRPFDYQLLHFGKEIPLLIPKPQDFSFPSGHTNASFAAAMALLLYHRKAGIPAMILAFLIAFSRLYLYVHYPTDVLTSVLLGVGVAYLANFLVNKGNTLYKLKIQNR
jgi:undecaprenyl-diphosphatase